MPDPQQAPGNSMPRAYRMQRWIERRWYAGRPPLLLRPCAALYGLLMRLRRRAYQRGWLASLHPGVPTVVIGNLTVGGTGKTPLAIWLASELRARGYRPGLVLRGHGGRQRSPRLVQGEDDAAQVGDEAVLLAQRTGCPVAVGVRRAAAARLLVEAGCDLVLADDGLQHLALRRDLEIIVIDGERGFGNGALLPAGPLREPADRIAEAALLVMHGEDRRRVLPAGSQGLSMRLAPLALRNVATGAEAPLSLLRGARVHALAGTGHPQRFFALLRELGAQPLEHPRPDHHRPRAGELDFGDDLAIVMTEKDAVKWRPLVQGREHVYCLPVAVELAPADAAHLIERVLAAGRS